MQQQQKVEETKRKNDTKLLAVVDDDFDVLTFIKKSLGPDTKIKVYEFTNPLAAAHQFMVNSQDYDAGISD